MKQASHMEKSSSSSMMYEELLTKIKRILTIQIKVFDELIRLDPTMDSENRERRISSSTGNPSAQQETADKTMKVTEERNKYVVEICKRIRDKPDGLDLDPLTQSSISEQIYYTIREATDIENFDFYDQLLLFFICL